MCYEKRSCLSATHIGCNREDRILRKRWQKNVHDNTTSHWQDAAIRNLEIIGEAVKRLSDDFKSQYKNIPWRNVAGLRDVLIHDYMGVDLGNVWNVIQQNLPDLKKVVKEKLDEPG